MDLDEGPLDRQQGVAQRHAGMRQAARVHDRHVEVAGVEAVDEEALVVRLEEGDAEPELGGAGRDPAVDLVERLVPVDLGLARPDQVEVRALQDEDLGHAGLPAASSSPAAWRTVSSGTSAWTSTPDSAGSTQRS